MSTDFLHRETRQTDLLRCGHHYRASLSALLAAGATVLDLNGAPVPEDPWEQVRAGR